MIKVDMQKLEILLKHWIEHTEEHGKEFQKWAKKAKTFSDIVVHDNILRAIEKMCEANEYLLKALEKLS